MLQRKRFYTGSKYEELAGYCRAVCDDDGWIFVSGTVGYDFKTGQLPETARGQTAQALLTIEEAMAEASATMADIVRIRVYVPNPDDVVEVSAVIKAKLGSVRPANTTICSPLAVPKCKVEIEVTARKLG